jgi:UDP-N-acetylmuramate--alanine ligase
MPFVSRPITTYGVNPDAQVRAVNLRADGTTMHFDVERRSAAGMLPRLSITLNLPGKHNVLNALAAIAVATELGVADSSIAGALAAFNGVGRRFTQVGEFAVSDQRNGGAFTLIDDYGHHPVEMAATLDAARGAWPERRIVLAFQPHRYTRTRDCFEDFVRVLSSADAVLLTDVYPAGEAPLVAADGRALSRAIRVAGKVEPLFVEDVVDLPQAILDFVQDGDVVIVMGAGSISKVPARIGELA